nr:hypothetical protein Iba_chr11bCG7360 [Ipomoea batatas]
MAREFLLPATTEETFSFWSALIEQTRSFSSLSPNPNCPSSPEPLIDSHHHESERGMDEESMIASDEINVALMEPTIAQGSSSGREFLSSCGSIRTEGSSVQWDEIPPIFPQNPGSLETM